MTKIRCPKCGETTVRPIHRKDGDAEIIALRCRRLRCDYQEDVTRIAPIGEGKQEVTNLKTGERRVLEQLSIPGAK